MNMSKPLGTAIRYVHSWYLLLRTLLPAQKSRSFGATDQRRGSVITSIVAVNLDRQALRWTNVHRELKRVQTSAGLPLAALSRRHSAFDAREISKALLKAHDVDPNYTLADQLFVEPQPEVIPETFDLTAPIRMSDAELAVAQSHVDVWKAVSLSNSEYTLVLEDDIWFDNQFAKLVDLAWDEMTASDNGAPKFDLFYLSYQEVKHGAPKTFITANVFRPERGIWYLSGYVLSRRGAVQLLKCLPCRGPVDLWINQQFANLDVRAIRRSVIHQRLDYQSTNLYSILPALTKIGILNDGSDSLFQKSVKKRPVFAFGAPGSGLSSFATALAMLGYRCASDLDTLPENEKARVLSGAADRVFDAYINIGSLAEQAGLLKKLYPEAVFFVLSSDKATSSEHIVYLTALVGAGAIHMVGGGESEWSSACENLALAPPNEPYPVVREIGQRIVTQNIRMPNAQRREKALRHDPSPWIARSRADWNGISVATPLFRNVESSERLHFDDQLSDIDPSRWLLRDDTFPGNLALFRPTNVSMSLRGGLSLIVKEEALGVRKLSAGAISSRAKYLYGRFEAVLQATNTPGLVTGFFLHRDSPRQEIDIEISGNRPECLLVNVFYNPGVEGSKFDYGYRGTPVRIALGFDASKEPHRYAIEWDPCEIRWLVDNELVHRRSMWNPTPIPDQPMTLHANTWPTRSEELGGRMRIGSLPASAHIYRIIVDSHK